VRARPCDRPAPVGPANAFSDCLMAFGGPVGGTVIVRTGPPAGASERRRSRGSPGHQHRRHAPSWRYLSFMSRADWSFPYVETGRASASAQLAPFVLCSKLKPLFLSAAPLDGEAGGESAPPSAEPRQRQEPGAAAACVCMGCSSPQPAIRVVGWTDACEDFTEAAVGVGATAAGGSSSTSLRWRASFTGRRRPRTPTPTWRRR
jgi:hypothetical protein